MSRHFGIKLAMVAMVILAIMAHLLDLGIVGDAVSSNAQAAPFSVFLVIGIFLLAVFALIGYIIYHLRT